jgi:AICAR transformylase/IMP cyclohydrolase PurH
VACGGNAGIGGTVNGLANGQTVVLQNNGADNLSVVGTTAASIDFDFATSIASGSTYNATVLTQPLGQTCTVANGSGTIDVNGSGVSNIVVTCTTTASVAASVTGLKSGLGVTLATNGQTLPVASNGTFPFPTIITAGATYNVTVTVQPSGQTCTVTNPTGTVVSGTTFTVAVNCV